MNNNVKKDSSIINMLEWAYKQALSPDVIGVKSAYELAEEHLQGGGTLKSKTNVLIFLQDGQSAATGFVTGLGGLITLPLTIPANVAAILFIQVRMIVTIAIMGGCDVKNEKVKTLVYTCLADTVLEELSNEIKEEIGTTVVEKVAESVTKKVVLKQSVRHSAKLINKESVKRMHKIVEYQLARKISSRGMNNFSKVIPFLGGIIGGALDAMSTHNMGKTAQSTFILT